MAWVESERYGLFEEAKKLELKHAKIAAFGSTRRGNLAAKDDPQLQTLLDAETPVVTILEKPGSCMSLKSCESSLRRILE